MRFAMIPAHLLAAPCSDRGFRVLAAILLHCDPAGRCHPTNARLASVTGLSPRTVARAVGELEAEGLVQVEGATKGRTLVVPGVTFTPTGGTNDPQGLTPAVGTNGPPFMPTGGTNPPNPFVPSGDPIRATLGSAFVPPGALTLEQTREQTKEQTREREHAHAPEPDSCQTPGNRIDEGPAEWREVVAHAMRIWQPGERFPQVLRESFNRDGSLAYWWERARPEAWKDALVDLQATGDRAQWNLKRLLAFVRTAEARLQREQARETHAIPFRPNLNAAQRREARNAEMAEGFEDLFGSDAPAKGVARA